MDYMFKPAVNIAIDSTLGSEGVVLEQTAPDRFRAVLAPSRGLPLVPNMLQFRCTACGYRDIEIETVFPVENPRGMFDEYPHSATPDFVQFAPAEWLLPRNGRRNILHIPATGWGDFRVGMQAAYPNTMVEADMHRWSAHSAARHGVIGQSIQGRAIHALRVGPRNEKPQWRHWVVNQHPGEGNARWRIKGMIDTLLSDRPWAASLRQDAEIFFVPMLCPDGPANGWRRVNADGVDMNRCHRMDGPDPGRQTHEAYLLQHLMESEMPDTLWCMHTWPGITEPVLDGAGNEFGGRVGTADELACLFDAHGAGLMKPLRRREEPGDPTTWNGGAHRRLGITTFLIEGGGEPAEPLPHEQAGEALLQILAGFWKPAAGKAPVKPS